jgi:hypothetical protein
MIKQFINDVIVHNYNRHVPLCAGDFGSKH